MRKLGIAIFLIMCVPLGIGLALAYQRMNHRTETVKEPGPGVLPAVRGFSVSLDAQTDPARCEAMLEQIKALGGNAVVLLSAADATGKIDGADAGPDRLERVARAAKGRKMHLWLAVAIDPHPGAGKDQEAVAPATYALAMKAVGRLAEKVQADGLCVGWRYAQNLEDAKYWRETFRSLRGVYSGRLMFLTTPENLPYIQWWDVADVVGETGSFAISGKAKPSREELMNGWDTPVVELVSLAAKYGRPGMFVDIDPGEEMAPGLREASCAAFLEESMDRGSLMGLFLRGNTLGDLAETVGKHWKPK